MKYLKNITIYLQSLIFLVFGLNFFFNFLPMPPMEGPAGQFAGIMYQTGYLTVLKSFEILLGVGLIFPKFRKLSLIMLAPICLNIFLFEALIVGQVTMGALLMVLCLVNFYLYRKDYLKLID
jgi:hypothetical protein